MAAPAGSEAEPAPPSVPLPAGVVSVASAPSKMLDLIYTGNEGEALLLFEEAWPETYPGKQKALKRFRVLVEGSPFDPGKR